mmetsp:Transcript_5441/g.11244  ORF Transcript_5441/g.11244 Transcript_5441/m.11244 type:complete len:80 (+) Transcript_5441:253-492(+)
MAEQRLVPCTYSILPCVQCWLNLVLKMNMDHSFITGSIRFQRPKRYNMDHSDDCRSSQIPNLSSLIPITIAGPPTTSPN